MDTSKYDRLKAVADLPLDDMDEEAQYNKVADGVNDLWIGLRNFVENVQDAMEGEAGDAVVGATTAIMADLDQTKAWIRGGRILHTAARDSMRQAKEDSKTLSDVLVSPSFWNYIVAGGMVIVPGVGPMGALEYLNHVQDYNNEQRENAAGQILDKMGALINEAGSNLPPFNIDPIPWPDPSASTQDTADSGGASGGTPSGGSSYGSSGSGVPAWPGSSGAGSGYPGFPDSGSGAGFVPGSVSSYGSVGSGIPDWSGTFGGASGGVPDGSSYGGGGSSYGGGSGVPSWSGSSSVGSGYPGSSGSASGTSFVPGSGSSSGGVAWGVVPVFVPNGPSSGVTPAPVTNQFDPAWKAGYSVAPASSMTAGGSIPSGGWTAAGGAGYGGAAGAGYGGAGAAYGGVGSGGVGGAGSGVRGGAGLAGSGVPGSGSSVGAGAEGGSGAGGAGSRGGMAGGAGGAGSSQDEKLKRRKYKVFKFRADQDPEDWEMPEAAGPGRAEDLKPLFTEDDDEYWQGPIRPRGPRR